MSAADLSTFTSFLNLSFFIFVSWEFMRGSLCPFSLGLQFDVAVFYSVAHGTSNAVLLSTNFCAKTKETPVYQRLRSRLRIIYFALYKCSLYYYYYYYYST